MNEYIKLIASSFNVHADKFEEIDEKVDKIKGTIDESHCDLEAKIKNWTVQFFEEFREEDQGRGQPPN